MNNTIKILILVFSVAFAIGGVLVYAKTIVAPPIAPRQTNQYINNLNEELNNLLEAKTHLKEDSIFQTSLNKIAIYVSESKISMEEGDLQIDTLLSIYSKLFIKRSFAYFSQSRWVKSKHVYIMSNVSKLRKIRHYDGSSVLPCELSDSLKILEHIISDYDMAKSISCETKFTSVKNARILIDRAEKYAKDPYLSHCSELVHQLNGLKPKIAQSHYEYLQREVERLSQYTQYSQSYFEEILAARVNEEINEYDDNADSLYGTRCDTGELTKKAEQYFSTAIDYYETNSNNSYRGIIYTY